MKTSFFKDSNKVSYKLIYISMASSFIGLFIFTLVTLIYSIGLIKEKRGLRIDTEMIMLSTNLVAPVLFEDVEATQDVLKSIYADPEILSVTVTSSSSSFETSVNNEEAEKKFYQYAVNHDYKSTSNKQITIFEQAIFDGEEELGIIKLYASNRQIRTQAVNVLITSSVVFLGTFALIFLVSFKLQRFITVPIERLNKTSKKISDTKDYSLRVSIDSNDEIGLLSKEFNSMLEQIEQRDLMLESKVKHRTSELERLADEFRHRAFHDSLTGLPNRALLYEKFPKSISHAKRVNKKIALILIDLDNFKTINDTMGHDFGDELLKIFAERLTDNLRGEDLVCRLGGDEFIVLAEDLACLDDLNRIGANLFKILEDDIIVKGKKLDVGMSVGGAVYPDHGLDITKVKRAADIAMYHAKDAGKNQYYVFRHEMEEATIQRLIVQNDLKTAIEEEQLKLYFQPKINSKDNSVAGCEVLIRWLHPQYGLLFPDTFIPYAEEGGQMELIDYYVMDKAFAQAAEWAKARHDFVVSVNLSGAHFHNHKIAKKLVEIMGRYNLDPSLIEIELTEAVLISDPKTALEVVSVIKSLGIRVALDDFGVGYSSLSYLRTFPVDIIKLDKSFILGLLTSKQDKRLTKGIISLAKGLELELVAEGVETLEHAEYLKAIGCHYLQGFHFLKPVPKDDFELWLSRRSIPSSISN